MTTDPRTPGTSIISANLAPERAVIPASANLPYTTMSGMFEHVWKDGPPDAAQFARFDSIPVSRRYAICMLPRSGSTYLTHMLEATGRFGVPREWLEFQDAEIQAREVGATDWDTLLRRVLARHASPNGVTGFELPLSHLIWGRQATGRKRVLERDMRYFYLRRRNIVRQGISMHIAHQSGVLHSYQLDEDARTVRDAVLYDTQAIRSWIKYLHDQELVWEREFGALAIEPVRLYYEDLIQRPERVVRLFAHVLDLADTPPTPVSNPISRVSDVRTDEWEARYRQEDTDYLAGLVRHRPFVHTPVQMT